PAMVNSPATELADNINSTQTTIKVNDLSKLPDPPNIATLGTTEDCETILYESIDVANSTLTNVTRGFEGVAKAWWQGTPVHRTVTARDYEAMRQNILNLLSALGAHQQASPLDHPDGSVTAAKIAEGAIDALAKIAATIRTTPGGTQPNRLAVTDASGRVGDGVGQGDRTGTRPKSAHVAINASVKIPAPFTTTPGGPQPHRSSPTRRSSDLASPLDHPDGSVTAAKIAEGAIDALAKIAATIRTTPGGTQPNRLAVTDANGRVGDSERL